MRKNIIVAMASQAVLPAVSFAAAPTLSDVLDASGISVTGHASGSYAYTHAAQDGTPSTSGNQFTFDQAELTISKLPTEGFGALVDVYAGQDVAGGTYNYGGMGSVPAIYPVAAFQPFAGGDVQLHQAYVQYATGGLTVIAGKFATLAGYEVASDAMNNNATRSILFSQQAFTLTGVRAAYKFSDMVTAYVGLSNSAAAGTTVDANDQKTVELAVALAPVTGLTVNVTDYIGNESGAAGNRVNLADVVVAYTAGDLSLGLNGDYNTYKPGGAGKTAKFSGVALYGNYQVSKTFRAGIRGEIGQSKDGAPAFVAVAGTDKVKFNEFTLTGDYSAAKNFDLVGDLRYATMKDDTAGGKEKDTTAVIKAIYKF